MDDVVGLEPLDRVDSDGPLTVVARSRQGGRQLWSSTDGQVWQRLGQHPPPGMPLPPLEAGYLAVSEDHSILVSPTGDEWSVVDGLRGVGATSDELGGHTTYGAAPGMAFIADTPNVGDRLLWAIRVDQSATP